MAVEDAAADTEAGLAGRTEVVGGIESLVLDGRRLWFGFDFTSDQVLSPLIDDAGAMARFAARHMRQRTGAHDEAYWAELVASAVDSSDLVWRDEQRAFTTSALEAGDAGPAAGHLLYLLDAATEWDGHAPADLPAAGLPADVPADLPADLPADAEEAEQTLRAHHAVGNWSLLFAPYIRGLPHKTSARGR
ncbi:hypothetical protein ACIOC1_10065 [Streptomyces sp. NPDC088197]|uniref:hypothetical protein n=1 Tax=Streptomyces sp. NPDC088197 TaxID=3365840 RepID=UPI0037F10A3E